jgi:hypothetical protein
MKMKKWEMAKYAIRENEKDNYSKTGYDLEVIEKDNYEKKGYDLEVIDTLSKEIYRENPINQVRQNNYIQIDNKREGNFIREEEWERIKKESYWLRDIEIPTYIGDCPPEDYPEEVCLMAVKLDGMAIEDIRNPTEEICLEAVKQKGYALKYIKLAKQTEEMCLIAVKDDPKNICFVRRDMQTEKICLNAVRKEGLVLKYIKPENRTGRVCLEAIKEDKNALDYVRWDHKFVCKEYLALKNEIKRRVGDTNSFSGCAKGMDRQDFIFISVETAWQDIEGDIEEIQESYLDNSEKYGYSLKDIPSAVLGNIKGWREKFEDILRGNVPFLDGEKELERAKAARENSKRNRNKGVCSPCW